MYNASMSSCFLSNVTGLCNCVDFVYGHWGETWSWFKKPCKALRSIEVGVRVLLVPASGGDEDYKTGVATCTRIHIYLQRYMYIYIYIYV